MAHQAVKIRPFKINVPQEEVDRLTRQLRDTRLPSQPVVPDAGEDYGPSLSWIQRLHNKWMNEFSWRTAEAHLNRLEHFIASVPDRDGDGDYGHFLDIHFTHTKSSRPDAIPMIMVHGWPGSFFEFDRVIEPFANPSELSDPAFHVVCPSLPGFCFSSGPPRRGWTMQDSARVFHYLMLSLGYNRYVTQAGDWGSFTARELGARFPTHCRGVHLNFCPTPLPDGLTASDLSEREKSVEKRCQAWLDDHLGYAVMMRTRPHSIGVALYDNPVGLLIWVGEKYAELASPKFQTRHADLWDSIILTTVSLYYFSRCILTSTLPYFENVRHAQFGEFFLRPENRIDVPFGYTSFFYDSRPSHKRAVERTGNLVLYNEVDDGGHFACLECPEVVLADCRKLFGAHFKP